MERASVYIFNDEDKLLHVSDEYVDDESILEEDIDNDSNNLTVVFPYTADACDYIEGENQIVVKDLRGVYRLWTIKEVEDVNGDEGKLKMAICMPSYVELNDAWVYERRPQDMPINDVLDVVLDGTRFERGRTGDYGTRSTSLYYQSVMESLKHIRSVWGGEYIDRVEFDDHGITGRFIDWERRGVNNGKRFEIDKDIQSIKRTVLHYPKTALIGRGGSIEVGEGNSRKITFEDVEWNVLDGDPVDKPKGQRYVGDPESLESYGIKAKDGKIHRIGIYDNDDITDPEELLQVTWDNVQKNNKPQVKYEMAVRTFYGIADYEHEQVYLGDTGYIIDEEMRPALTVQSRIIKISYSIGNPSIGDITVGNFLRIKDDDSKIDWVINKVTESSGSWDNGGVVEIGDNSFPNVKPPTPDNLQATGLFSSIMLKWDYDPSVYIAEYRVYGSTNSNFVPSDSDNFLYATKSGGYAHDADVNEQWYFVVCAVNTHGQRSDFSQRVMAQTKQIDGNTEISEQTITKELLAQQAMIDEVHLNNAIITDAHINGRLSSNVLQIGDGALYDDGYDPMEYAIKNANWLRDTHDHEQQWDVTGQGWGDILISNNHSRMPIREGQRFTISTYFRNESNKPVGVRARLRSSFSSSDYRDFSVKEWIQPGEEGWSTITFTVPEGYHFLTVFGIRFYSSTPDATGTIYYSRLKMEEGGVRTPWVPYELSDQITANEFNLLKNGTFNEGMAYWAHRAGRKPNGNTYNIWTPESDKPNSSILQVGPYDTDRTSPLFNSVRVPVKAGDRFILKYDVRIMNLDMNFQYMSLRTFDDPNDEETNGTADGIYIRTSGVNGSSFSTNNTGPFEDISTWYTKEHVIEITEDKYLAVSIYFHLAGTEYQVREVGLYKSMQAPKEYKGDQKDEKPKVNMIGNGTFNTGERSWDKSSVNDYRLEILEPEDDKRDSHIGKIDTTGIPSTTNYDIRNERRLLRHAYDILQFSFDVKFEEIPNENHRIFRFYSYDSPEGYDNGNSSSLVVNNNQMFNNVISFEDINAQINDIKPNTWYTVSFVVRISEDASDWIQTSIITDGAVNQVFYLREIQLINTLEPKQFQEDAGSLWGYRNTTYIDGGAIYANSVTANEMATNTITANSAIIANGAIGSAQIRELDASKLTAGSVIAQDIIIKGHLDGVTGTFAGKLLSLYVDSGWATPPFSTATEIEHGYIHSLRYDRGSFQIGDGGFRLSRYPGGVIDSEYDDLFNPDDIGQTIEDLKFRETSVLEYDNNGLTIYGNGSSSSTDVLSLITNGKTEIRTSNDSLLLRANPTTLGETTIDIGSSKLLFSQYASIIPGVSAEESGSSSSTTRDWLVIANESIATINGLRTDFRYTEIASRENIKLFSGTDQKSVQGTPISGNAIDITTNDIEFYRTNNNGSYNSSFGKTRISGREVYADRLIGDSTFVTVRSTDSYVYLQTPSQVRVTRPSTTTGWMPLRCDRTIESSSILYKHNIEELTSEDANMIIDSINPVSYVTNSDVEISNYGGRQIGVISQMSPHEITEEDAVNYRSLFTAAVKIIKDEKENRKKLEKEIDNIYLILEQMI
ncbi:phage tail protein [Oceanobacillus kimchii]|uniref:phage tail protein n=1 Tax=Oceanobacillus kimchii TaxID=746691 RepID=UPI0021A79757|nr:phage tail protein [Oceanobacillus kimchii]MCT1577944.1 phage tail protein [Oceanobacillus kimchii]MCT2137504.1 phage tail protein [Oceanobacillus kimchii]